MTGMSLDCRAPCSNTMLTNDVAGLQLRVLLRVLLWSGSGPAAGSALGIYASVYGLALPPGDVELQRVVRKGGGAIGRTQNEREIKQALHERRQIACR